MQFKNTDSQRSEASNFLKHIKQMDKILTIQFFGGLFEEFVCSGAHFSRHKEDVRLSLGTNIFHQMSIVLGPLLLLSRRKRREGSSMLT